MRDALVALRRRWCQLLSRRARRKPAAALSVAALVPLLEGERGLPMRSRESTEESDGACRGWLGWQGPRQKHRVAGAAYGWSRAGGSTMREPVWPDTVCPELRWARTAVQSLSRRGHSAGKASVAVKSRVQLIIADCGHV